MLRWFNPRKAVAPPIGDMAVKGEAERNVTDDPLAVIDTGQMNGRIYSVSRSVLLPRVALKNVAAGGG